jgi:hypothetical protein
MTTDIAPGYGTGLIQSWDVKSETFPVGAVLDLAAAPTPRRWVLADRINQGNAPKCVGASLGQELNSTPVVIPITQPGTMDNIYNLAQQLDEWPGNAYDGTSLLAGLKALKQFGYVTEYRWAASPEEVALALSQLGPVILAGPWLSGMFQPDADGRVRVTGSAGNIGHCYELGELADNLADVVIEQTWGPQWSRLPGVDGGWRGKLALEDVRRLMSMGTQAAIITGRADPNAPTPPPPTPPPTPPPAPRRTITISGVDLVVSG